MENQGLEVLPFHQQLIEQTFSLAANRGDEQALFNTVSSLVPYLDFFQAGDGLFKIVNIRQAADQKNSSTYSELLDRVNQQLTKGPSADSAIREILVRVLYKPPVYLAELITFLARLQTKDTLLDIQKIDTSPQVNEAEEVEEEVLPESVKRYKAQVMADFTDLFHKTTEASNSALNLESHWTEWSPEYRKKMIGELVLTCERMNALVQALYAAGNSITDDAINQGDVSVGEALAPYQEVVTTLLHTLGGKVNVATLKIPFLAKRLSQFSMADIQEVRNIFDPFIHHLRIVLEQLDAQGLKHIQDELLKNPVEHLKPNTKGDLNFHISDILNEWESREKLPKTIVLMRELTSDSLHMRLNHTSLSWIFTNLLGNAIRYMYKPGKISVKTTLEIAEPVNIAVIEVSDEGAGISPEDLPHIREKGWSRRGVGEPLGTGQGLAIVDREVDRHGGTMDVNSTVGVGTTFTIRLPLYQ